MRRPVHICLDHGDFHTMSPPPPLSDLGGGGGLSLAIEAYHQDGLVVWSDFSSRTEDSHEFAVYHVHGVGLEFQARSSSSSISRLCILSVRSLVCLTLKSASNRDLLNDLAEFLHLFLIQGPFSFKRPTEPSILRFSPSNAMSRPQ